MTPVSIQNVRRNLCVACPSPCDYRENIDLGDNCTACPIGRWHTWDCAASQNPGSSVDPPVPSLGQRIVNLATQAVLETGAIVFGTPAPSAEEVKRRMAICQTNSCKQYREDGRCAACGCPMAQKTPWRSAKCPRGLW